MGAHEHRITGAQEHGEHRIIGGHKLGIMGAQDHEEHRIMGAHEENEYGST